MYNHIPLLFFFFTSASASYRLYSPYTPKLPPCSLVSFWTVGSRGRRKLFLIGSFGQMISMIITFGCLILYIAFFGVTSLTVRWLYAAEINPLRIRAKGAAAANVVNWSINFLVVMVTPIMVAHIKWGTYVFFAAVNACFIPFM